MSSESDSYVPQYAQFIKPIVQYNPQGWGPCDDLEMGDIPYQPFCKSDRLGKICDWTNTGVNEKKFGNKYVSSFGNNNQYAYYHDDDDNTFHLVDSNRLQRLPHQRKNYRPNMRNTRSYRGRLIRNSNMANTLMMSNNATGAMAQSNRNAKQRDIRRGVGKRYGSRVPQRIREPSVMVHADWISLEEMDFPRLLKLQLPNIKDGEDVLTCGALDYYDKLYDRVNLKNEKLLQKFDSLIVTPTTLDDPIIRRLSRTVGNVFATDDILATIMCTTRSNYSWDILVEKLGNNIFFDKRNYRNFSLLTVNETSVEPPNDEEGSINSTINLSMEATLINHNFIQQVLKVGEQEQHYNFQEPNPFVEHNTLIANVGYRYRRWNLGNNIVLVARCKQDGVLQCPNGEYQFLTIKVLNEWDSKAGNTVDWRQKLDNQRGAVLASELRNNACKLAKWTVEAILSGADQLKLGYVSRASPRDNLRHFILGTQQFKPQEFATQINLNMDNAWGILRCIIDLVMKQRDGKYLIMKDPNKQLIRLYDIPDNTFDDERAEFEEQLANKNDILSAAELYKCDAPRK